ncbi:hypothetical protein ACVK1X_001086 [Pseudomonas sp. PvR086]
MPSTLVDIIIRDRGAEAYSDYAGFQITDPDVIVSAARQTLESIPPSFGSCVMVSAGFTAILKSQKIPAVVVLGELLINGQYAFECRGNIPGATYEGEFVDAKWDGHAWVMLAGVLCDLSIFRSAYATKTPSNLKTFISQQFGEGNACRHAQRSTVPSGLLSLLPGGVGSALEGRQAWRSDQ